jgi:hypothetical protein
MSGIYYALSIVGVFIIIHWFVMNDRRQKTSGLLAMKPPPESEDGDEQS